MLPGVSESSILRFDSFELDLKNHELRKSGRPRKLERRAFQILTLLACRPNELVTRETIYKQVWEGDKAAAESLDERLDFQMKEIRAALGDSSKNPRYIQTVRGLGYKFIGSVEVLGQPFASPAATAGAEAHASKAATPSVPGGTPGDTAAGQGWSKTKLVRLGALLATACTLLIVYTLVRLRPATPEIRSVQFTATGNSQSIVLEGRGFGSAPADLPHLPAMAKTGYFRIFNSNCSARSLGCEAGYIRDKLGLNYRSWSSNRIWVSDYGVGSEGDAIEIGVWNPQAEQGAAAAAWGGNIPPVKPGTPQILKVMFDTSGEDLGITVLGKGFGSAPPGVPCVCDTNFLSFGDYAYHNFREGGAVTFVAGYRKDDVTLVYSSWSDSEIRLGGFGGGYRDNGMVVHPGDPIAIHVWSTSTGLATAWGGRVPR